MTREIDLRDLQDGEDAIIHLNGYSIFIAPAEPDHYGIRCTATQYITFDTARQDMHFRAYSESEHSNTEARQRIDIEVELGVPVDDTIE